MTAGQSKQEAPDHGTANVVGGPFARDSEAVEARSGGSTSGHGSDSRAGSGSGGCAHAPSDAGAPEARYVSDAVQGPNAAEAPGIEPEPDVAGLAFGERLGLAREYVQALSTDGVLRGLIGPREPGRLWTRHVLNSAAVAELIPPGARVVDIGSGAGLPGIPLAIARPDLKVDLVEPLERRVRFLQEICERLGLTCRVIRGRAEDVVTQCGRADVVTSRAVAPLHRLVGWSTPLIRDGGLLLAMKGASAVEELERDLHAVAAAGLVDAEVLQVGGQLSAEPTFVVRARRRGVPSRSGRRSGRQKR